MQQSVAERLKNSLASFKSNKLTMDKDKNKSMMSQRRSSNLAGTAEEPK
jgi:hypothetical protein